MFSNYNPIPAETRNPTRKDLNRYAEEKIISESCVREVADGNSDVERPTLGYPPWESPRPSVNAEMRRRKDSHVSFKLRFVSGHVRIQ